MDHLPVPSNPAFPPLTVPCLSDLPYDGLDFDSYPERRGWSKNRLLAGEFTEKSADETAAFLQDWLYFGVLHVTLGCYGEKSFFVTSCLSSPYGRITSRLLDVQLCLALEQLLGLLRENKVVQALTMLRKAENCLKSLSDFCRTGKQDFSNPRSSVTSSLSAEIDLSFRVLGTRLASAFYAGLMLNRSHNSVLPHLDFSGAQLALGEWCKVNGVQATWHW